MSVELNRDYNLREQLLFGEDYDAAHYRMGGIRRFENIAPSTLAKLLELRLIDPNDAQNSSPTAEEFLNFFEEHDMDDGGWYVHGYAVSPTRDDYRITIEGCGKSEAPTFTESFDFTLVFRHADELNVDEYLYCWYD